MPPRPRRAGDRTVDANELLVDGNDQWAGCARLDVADELANQLGRLARAASVAHGAREILGSSLTEKDAPASALGESGTEDGSRSSTAGSNTPCARVATLCSDSATFIHPAEKLLLWCARCEQKDVRVRHSWGMAPERVSGVSRFARPAR
jgi:hypothetical protein